MPNIVPFASSFQAKWTPSTAYLQTPKRTLHDKIGDGLWNLVSILIPVIGLARLLAHGLGQIALRKVLPAVYLPREVKDEYKKSFHNFWYAHKMETVNQRLLRDLYSAEPHAVATPDGAELHAQLFRYKNAQADTPLIIYFSSNAFLSMEEAYLWLINLAVQRQLPCHFVLFDYRSAGNSKGMFKRTKDLLVDGISIIQWVKEGLKIPADQIHFYGRSLGGAIALESQAMDPTLTGRNVNERSFYSIHAVVESEFVKGPLKILSPVFRWLVESLGCELNPLEAFLRLPVKKMVVYHPKDPIVPYRASLEGQLQGIEHESLELKAMDEEKGANHHNRPICEYVDAESGKPAGDCILDFILLGKT